MTQSAIADARGIIIRLHTFGAMDPGASDHSAEVELDPVHCTLRAPREADFGPGRARSPDRVSGNRAKMGVPEVGGAGLMNNGSSERQNT